MPGRERTRPSSGRTADRCRSRRRTSPAGAAATPLAAPAGPGAGGAEPAPGAVQPRPLLNQVRDDTGLSAAAAGLLTTAPVLCLGLFAPLAPRLARRIGAERSVLLILFCLAGGIVLRSLFPVFGLFAGSVLAGASIGIIGVLLPGIVKRDFPRQAGVMTGVYTMALCLGAALAAGATAPLEKLFGNWELALAFWSLPAILAAAFWLPQTRQGQHAHRQALPCHRPVARPAGLAGHAVHGPAIVPGLHRLRLAAVDPDRPRHDCGRSRPGAVRLGDAATDHRPARALARRSRQGPAPGGGAGDGDHPRRPARLPLCAAADHLGLGGPARPRPGRYLQHRPGADRPALARRPRRLASVGHGPGRRLHPGGHGAVHGRRGPRPDRRLERGRLYLHRRRHRRHPVRPRRRAQPGTWGPAANTCSPADAKAPHRGAFSPSSLRHPGRALRRAASAACWRSSR